MMNIPGVIPFGEAALAESLRWPLRAFRHKFHELQRKKMVLADWKSQFVWIPNAIKYNPPESPNVVKSWLKVWSELPECRLKNQAFSTILKTLENMGEGFQGAFVEGFPEGFPKGFTKVYGESGTGTVARAEARTKQHSAKAKPPSLPCNETNGTFTQLTAHIKESFKRMTGASLMLSKVDDNTIKALIGEYAQAQLMALWDMFAVKDWDWKNRDGRVTKKVPHDVKNFREKISELLEDASWKERMKKYEAPDDKKMTEIVAKTLK